MNKVSAIHAYKNYQAAYSVNDASEARKAQSGKSGDSGSGSLAERRKGQAKDESFRDILAKKLKSA